MATQPDILIHERFAVLDSDAQWFTELREVRGRDYRSYSVVQGNTNELLEMPRFPGARQVELLSLEEALQLMAERRQTWATWRLGALISDVQMMAGLSESPIDGVLVRPVAEVDYRDRLIACARQRGGAQLFD